METINRTFYYIFLTFLTMLNNNFCIINLFSCLLYLFHYSLLITSSNCIINMLFHILTRVRFCSFIITRVALPTTMCLTTLHITEIPSLLQQETHKNEINKKPIDWNPPALMMHSHNDAEFHE